MPRPTRTALQLDIPEADAVVETVARACLPGVQVFRPAHISLAYPWLVPAEASAALSELERVVSATPAIALRLGALQAFAPDTRGRRVLHLTVEPADPISDLAIRVAGARASHPHLSVARIGESESAAPVMELVTPLLPVWAVARTVQLRVQYATARGSPGGQWWRVERVLHLKS